MKIILAVRGSLCRRERTSTGHPDFAGYHWVDTTTVFNQRDKTHGDTHTLDTFSSAYTTATANTSRPKKDSIWTE